MTSSTEIYKQSLFDDGRLLPPAGIYDVRVEDWRKTGHFSFEATLEIARGKYAGFQFPERFDDPIVPTGPLSDLYRGFQRIMNGGAITAHLVQRCVHGVDTMGLDRWGWR